MILLAPHSLPGRMVPEGGSENQRNPNQETTCPASKDRDAVKTLLVARESIAIISGSGTDNATTPIEGNAAVSSSPERERERESPPMQRSTSGR